MTESPKTRLLYIEDDEGLARLLQKRLTRRDYDVDLVVDAEQGLAALKEGGHDIVLTDYRLPGMNGLELIKSITAEGHDIPVIMLTGGGDEAVAVEAMKLDAADYLIKDADGNYLELLPRVIERALVTRRLIEEKQRAEQAQRAAEERNIQILESAGEGIYGLDLEGSTTFVNLAAVRMTGWESEDMLGKPQHSILHHSRADGSPYPREECPVFAAIKDGKVYNISDEVFWRKDGSCFPVEYTATPVLSKGKLSGAVVVFRDITERMQAEEALRSQEELFRSIASSAKDAIVLMDDKGDIAFVNEASERMFGFTREELQGKPLHKVMVPERYYDDFKEGFKKFKETGEGEIIGKTMELPVLRKDGTEFYADHSFSAVKLYGKWHSVALIRDTTERKRMEEELRLSKEDAEKASSAKSEFLAAMSHDLRTPLNAIMGFSEMMRVGIFGPLGDPRYEEYSKDIHESGRLLISLINDVLDLSKVEAGKYDLSEENLDIDALIQTTIKLMKPLANAAEVKVISAVPHDLPWLRADKRSLTQILNNLLSNAVKFTPEKGKTTVSAKVDGESFAIIVKDTGIGMSKKDIITAMEPFEQADSSLSRKHKGTGLGIHLCRKFMELHGGVLDIDSKEGKGTTVTISFPVERVAD